MFCGFVIFSVLLVQILGHGMVLDPPNRSSLWRFGLSDRFNYDDNALFCGGFDTQWYKYDGKCGVCGDSYGDPQPRKNENTGYYGQGIISKTYDNSSIIPVTVLITANHKGHFTFSLCELINSDSYEDEECFFDLKLADGTDKYVLPSTDVGLYFVELQLPADFTCKRCVLRWTYTAGNNWGVCLNSNADVGCGPQETFKTCSDISIE